MTEGVCGALIPFTDPQAAQAIQEAGYCIVVLCWLGPHSRVMARRHNASEIGEVWTWARDARLEEDVVLCFSF